MAWIKSDYTIPSHCFPELDSIFFFGFIKLILFNLFYYMDMMVDMQRILVYYVIPANLRLSEFECTPDCWRLLNHIELHLKYRHIPKSHGTVSVQCTTGTQFCCCTSFFFEKYTVFHVCSLTCSWHTFCDVIRIPNCIIKPGDLNPIKLSTNWTAFQADNRAKSKISYKLCFCGWFGTDNTQNHPLFHPFLLNKCFS